MLTADQWKRIERLFEHVENAPKEDRERLVNASGEEDSVQWEVLKMLNAASGGLLDVNLRARPASVYSPGDLLAGGRFRIDALIAEGGMGEVYRATDLELQIPIALKTVHRIFAHDNSVIERFKHEVNLARSVNHPNVCRIYDLEKQKGKSGRDEFFLTMELLEGETLRAFLDREQDQLSEAQAYRIIEPVLQALTASHERGILHRDLKPSNIHLAKAPNGETRVVVTDFGLAATALESATGESVSAGTPAYMAPEQFDRQATSPATDTYAATVVLYELVCGRLPFTARTHEDMRVQKAMNQAVPARQLAPGISKRWEAALHRGLLADPAQRFATVAEFHGAIRPSRRSGAWTAIAAAAAVVLAAGYVLSLNRPADEQTPLPRKLTTDTGYSMEPTASRDGQTIVYASDRGVNGVRSLWQLKTGGTPTQITFDDVDAYDPHLSFDSQWIVYRSERDGGGLYVMPAQAAGQSRLIAKAGVRPRFSPDGTWVLYMTRPPTPTQLPQVYAVRAQGGSPVNISAGFKDAHNPIWSGDGKYVLFCGTKTPGIRSEEHDWWVIPFLTGGVARKTEMLPSLAKLAPARNNEDISAWENGFVYYTATHGDYTSSIWRVRFQPTTLGLSEPPRRLTPGANSDRQPALAGGRMVFASGAFNSDIWTLPLNTSSGVPVGDASRVTDNTDYEITPAADPSGETLVYTKSTGPNRELRFMNWRTERDSKPWSEPGELADQAVWSGDGQWVAFRIFEKPKIRIWVKHRSGNEKRLICEDCGNPADWSPDQKYMLFEPGTTIAFVGRLDIATGTWVEWIKHPYNSLRDARYSPDGRRIAFTAETGTNQRVVFVAPNEQLANESQWVAIGDPGASEFPVDYMPSWSPDGKVVYFLSTRDGFRCIWAQRLDPVTGKTAGRPFDVQHFHRSRLSILKGRAGFRVYQGRAFFAMDETTGNLWITDLPR